MSFLHATALIGLLCLTLVSHYSYEYNVAFFSVSGAAIALAVSIFGGRKSLSNSTVVLLTLASSYFVLFGYFLARLNDFPVLYARASLILLAPTVCCFAYVLGGFPYLIRIRILKAVLLVHLIAFYSQFIYYLVFNQFLDLLHPVTGEEQRAFGGAYVVPVLGELFRSTGLLNEPSTYANTVFLLFLALKSIQTRGEASTTTPLDVAFLASIALSFSALGYVCLGVYYVFSVGSARGRWPAALMAVPLGLIGFAAYDYFAQRFVQLDGSGLDSRIEALLAFAAASDVTDWVFGWGFLANTTARFHQVVFNDSGFLFSLLVGTGAFGLVFFYLPVLLHPAKLRAPQLCFIAVMSMSKLSPATLLIWFLFCFVLVAPGRKRIVSLPKPGPGASFSRHLGTQ